MLPDIHGVAVECNYVFHSSHWHSDFSCKAIDLRTSYRDRAVTNVTGKLSMGRSEGEVTQFYSERNFCPFLPTGIGGFLKNLTVFYMMKSSVRHLMTGDLNGLTELRVFDVSHNPIEHLASDFFKGQSKIEIISFYDCHLKAVDAGALDHLVALKEGHFKYNNCIDDNASDADEVGGLKVEIANNCIGVQHNDINFEECYVESAASKSESKFDVVFFSLFVVFLFISLGLTFVLFRIFTKRFNNNFTEFTNAL